MLAQDIHARQSYGLKLDVGIMRSARYRHIVFAERSTSGGAPINFAAEIVQTVMPPPCADNEDAFLRWLFDRAGIALNTYRRETLRRRLPACLRSLRARSPSHARRLIERNRALLPMALESLVIGVTGLFRDPLVFRELADHILPELADRPQLRIWSAGCSHGAELYSIAALLADRDLLNRAHLLGTDCRPEATRRAAAGFFESRECRHAPAALLEQFFDSQPNGYRAKPLLRSAIHWRTGDLLSVLEPGVWDMILCRNLAIYLTASAATALWARLEQSLRPGGILVTGKAERPVGAERLAFVSTCIYKRSLG